MIICSLESVGPRFASLAGVLVWRSRGMSESELHRLNGSEAMTGHVQLKLVGESTLSTSYLKYKHKWPRVFLNQPQVAGARISWLPPEQFWPLQRLKSDSVS